METKKQKKVKQVKVSTMETNPMVLTTEGIPYHPDFGVESLVKQMVGDKNEK